MLFVYFYFYCFCLYCYHYFCLLHRWKSLGDFGGRFMNVTDRTHLSRVGWF